MSSLGFCPSCNRQIRISSKFCKYCGITLKTCPECNELNTVEDKFCGSCGEDISKVEAPELSREVRSEEQKGPRIEEIQEAGESQPKLVVWPPLPYAQQHTQQRPSPLVAEEQPLYDPSSLKHPYSKVKFFGYLRGTFPSTSVLSATIEVFGLALALIAVGIAIIG
ncbi:MAG: zinc ribbon domain-containing protein, partial [Candidatus Heimdallarchaeota archaeon]|nr:zinc ribbon domain-containing protein [Candidatus Heimdallarchaeota archaeon]MCK4955711.1 zinc ribbon domain-containing protein [Candidatus Heimdallarchaeota archaeon]